MKQELGRWIAVYDFSAGRRLFALELVQQKARDLGFTELVDHLDAALAHDRLTLHINGHWNSRRRRRARPQSMIVDRMMAKALTGLRRAALLQAEGAPPRDPIHSQVQEFLHAILPRGVFAVAMLPQVEELSVVTRLVQKLEGPLAETVAELGLARQAARVAELARAFGEALRAAEQPKVSFREVQAARRRGQEYLLEAVAMILGRYYRCNDPEHAAARTDLLSPIAQQSEAIRTYRRTRRSLKDVDPATGKETDTPSD